MRILLINPPFENTLKIGVDSEVIKMAGKFPPIGLLYIATVLKNSGFSPIVIDCPSMGITHVQLNKIIKNIIPDVVGITTFTTTMTDVLITAKNIKEIHPGAVVVIGGHHVYSYPELSAGYDNVDFILRGEAEYTFLELINRIIQKKKKQDMIDIPGIGFKMENKVYLNSEKNIVLNLDTLPILDRSFIDETKYNSIFDLKEKEVVVITSRGCPYECSFCFSPEKNYRSRSVENIISEIKLLSKCGYTNIFFFDDLFSIQEQKIVDLCKRIISEQIKIKWAFRGRLNLINDKLLLLAKKSGLQRIQFGIESFNQQVLDMCNKRIKREKIFTAIDLCKKHKIISVGNIIIGLPGQTKEIILSDIDFSIKSGLDFVEFHLFTPMPKTKIYNDAIAEGIIPYDFWEEYAVNPLENYKKFRMFYYDKNLLYKEQVKFCNYAYKKFYFRPKYILYRSSKIRSFRELKNHIIGAYEILKFKAKSDA